MQTADPAAPPAADAPERVPAPPVVTTLGETPHEPTARPWELELLISGAVVFALLQLPAELAEAAARVLPRLGAVPQAIATLFHQYVRLIVYTLIGAFLLHLSVRAYWVGLIGLESVFPRGPKWDSDRYGPVALEVYRETTEPLQSRIDRADRFASLIFSFAFALVFILALSIAAGVLGALLSWLALQLPGGERIFPWLLVLVGLVFALPPTAAALADRRWGARLPPEGRARRVIKAILRYNQRMSGSGMAAPILLTLYTNARRRSVNVTLAVVGTLMLAVFVTGSETYQERLRMDGYTYFPDEPGARGVEAAFYESARTPGTVPGLPSIQSDIVRDPYVKLFVPYHPRRHSVLMERRCPGVPRLSPTGMRLRDDATPAAAMEAVLACWARVQRVTLDGKPIAPDWRFHVHPATGLSGFLAYLPTAGLARGAHALEVDRAPRLRQLEGKLPFSPPYHIPFWL
ncbi:MAG TPA: hypothetical protein VHG91_17545 [Longimicrobium sp.]|nr:hypothetical protein [Longimicrobium sp.]